METETEVRGEPSGRATPAEKSAACIRCGYDLRGLPRDGRCPECALPVVHSLVGAGELRFAPRAFLSSLTWGASLVLLVLVSVFPYFAIVASAMVRESFERYVTYTAALFAVFAAGVWLLTRKQRAFDLSGPVRRWAMRAMALLLVVHPMLVYLVVAHVRFSPMLVTAAAVCIAPLPLLLMLHLRGLALRLPNRRVAWLCGAAGWAATAALALAIIDDVLELSPGARLGLTAAVLGFVSFFGSIFLLLRVAMAFARARRMSKWG